MICIHPWTDRDRHHSGDKSRLKKKKKKKKEPRWSDQAQKFWSSTRNCGSPVFCFHTGVDGNKCLGPGCLKNMKWSFPWEGVMSEPFALPCLCTPWVVRPFVSSGLKTFGWGGPGFTLRKWEETKQLFQYVAVASHRRKCPFFCAGLSLSIHDSLLLAEGERSWIKMHHFDDGHFHVDPGPTERRQPDLYLW